MLVTVKFPVDGLALIFEEKLVQSTISEIVAAGERRTGKSEFDEVACCFTTSALF